MRRIIFRFVLFSVFFLIVFLSSAYYLWYRPKFIPGIPAHTGHPVTGIAAFEKLSNKAGHLKSFARNHKYNNSICFLADMSIESGRYRFFVYDLKKDSVLFQGLVAHGSCDNGFQSSPEFSNTKNSGCSSLGKFRIGYKYSGQFGESFKLYGLDSSNNNAFERAIVLHSYQCVPEEETFPVPICNSRGCPMVSPGFMELLKPIIQKSPKPILLWIYQ